MKSSYKITYEKSQNVVNSKNSLNLLKSTSVSNSPLITSINTTPSQTDHNQYNLNHKDYLLTNSSPLSLSQTSS